MSDQCKTWYGTKRCNFEARYDVSRAHTGKVEFNNMYSGDLRQILDAFRTNTYVHDICTACGKIVKRDDPTNGN